MFAWVSTQILELNSRRYAKGVLGLSRHQKLPCRAQIQRQLAGRDFTEAKDYLVTIDIKSHKLVRTITEDGELK